MSDVTNNKMKAALCLGYGSPDVLEIKFIDKPIPKDDELLVKVYASAVNSGDVKVRTLDVNPLMKFVMRFVLGFSKPRKPVLGTVFSGVVECIGNNVKNFKIGDEVFGMTGFKFGTHAEYLTISENHTVTHKPLNASFNESAAIIFGGQTAHFFLLKAKINELKNPELLIYGSTGSVGVAAIQIAKYYNADFTVVCGSSGESLMKSLGAKNIILYDKEDYKKTSAKYDIIFDAVGKITKSECKHLLKDGGKFLTVGGMDYASEKTEQLLFLKKLFEAGKYNAVIDKVFKLDEIKEAHKYVSTGRKKGNVVLEIQN